MPIFSALESVARIQSVKSSGKIEGIVTADDRIAKFVDGNSHPDMAANRMCKIFLAPV